MKQQSLNRLFSSLRVGCWVIAHAANPRAISAEFARLLPMEFTQREVIVVDAIAFTAMRAWVVTRIT